VEIKTNLVNHMLCN